MHRREEILEHAARAEVDLGADLHAGDEPQSNRGQARLSSIEVSVQAALAQSDPIFPRRKK